MHLTSTAHFAIDVEIGAMRTKLEQVSGITRPIVDGDPLCSFGRLNALLDQIQTCCSAIRAIAGPMRCSGYGSVVDEPIIYCADCERYARSKRE